MRTTLIAAAFAAALPMASETNIPPEPAPKFGGKGAVNQQAGFGGSSFGVPISSGQLIVVAPKSKDSLAAWSYFTGEWQRIPIRPKEDDAVVPIVGTGVAAVRVGKMVYGYGAEAGKWHWIETETKVQPSIGTGSVTIEDGDWYYVLSSKTGKWTGLNLATGEIR